MYKLMWKNPWKEGRAKFSGKNVLVARADAVRRREKKADVRSCILTNIVEL